MDYINYVDNGTIKAEQKSYSANISGDMFELHVGMAAFAAGYE